MNSVDTNPATHKTNPSAPSAAESQLLQSSLMMMAQAHGDKAPAGPPGLSATPTVSALLQALRRRWMAALGLALIATALAVLAVFTLMPPKYQVTLRMRIVARQAGVDDIEFPIFKANMESLVKSPIVLSAALNDKTADGRDIKDLDIVRSKGLSATDWLEKNLKTDYLLGPEILRVTLPADQPEEAAQLLNAIGKAFLSQYAEVERSKKQERVAELRVKKERIEEELRSLRVTLLNVYKSLDVKDREAATVQQGQLLGKLAAAEATRRSNEDELAKADSEIYTANARLKNIDNQKVPEDVLFDFYSKDAIIQAHLKRLGDIEEEIARIFRTYNEPYSSQYATPLRHEKVKIRDQKAQRELALNPEIEQRWRKRVREDLQYAITLGEEKLQTGTRRRENLQKEIAELERKVKDAGPGILNKPTQIVATEEKIELARKALDNTAQKISDVELEPLPSRIIPLSGAVAPQEKDQTRQTKIAGAGGMGVFLLVLFGVAFAEFRARKINEPDEVAQGLGLNVIGTIPAMPAKSKKAATDPDKEHRWLGQLQESVDAIRTVILHQARNEALHVVMVTSAQSGEGKTTLATQLAASLARAWKRTLVIDADLRHPAAHALFEVPSEPGLAEVLRGEVEAVDAIRATSFSRLWVLPAGNGDAHAIQALAQDNIRTLFEQLKQQYDFIIIDTPPVLPVTDSLLIGQHVDGVVYAILRDVSRAPAIYAAQQKMAPLEIHTLGAVVLGTKAEFCDKYGYAMSAAAK